MNKVKVRTNTDATDGRDTDSGPLLFLHDGMIDFAHRAPAVEVVQRSVVRKGATASSINGRLGLKGGSLRQKR
jgi:hypothetical protein